MCFISIYGSLPVFKALSVFLVSFGHSLCSFFHTVAFVNPIDFFLTKLCSRRQKVDHWYYHGHFFQSAEEFLIIDGILDKLYRNSAAADLENLELLRVLRESDNLPAQDSAGESILLAESAAEAGEKAKALGGRVLLTTGSKDLKSFAQVLDPESLYPRVLPLGKSIQACEEAGIPHRNIIAIQGPFSKELNEAIIKEYDIQVMITKESGKAGGFSEKIEACKACHIPVIVIARPEDAGLAYEEVLALCREKMK